MHVFSHFAYLDAGTGSLIIQSVIGIVAGIGVFGRKIIASLRQKFAAATGRAEGKKNATK